MDFDIVLVISFCLHGFILYLLQRRLNILRSCLDEDPSRLALLIREYGINKFGALDLRKFSYDSNFEKTQKEINIGKQLRKIIIFQHLVFLSMFLFVAVFIFTD